MAGSHRWLDLELGRGPALESSSNNEGISEAKSSKLFRNGLGCSTAILVYQQNLGALIDPLQCLDFQSCYLQAHTSHFSGIAMLLCMYAVRYVIVCGRTVSDAACQVTYVRDQRSPNHSPARKEFGLQIAE